MSNARLYAKIMRHLGPRYGGQLWDFRTLNLSHPHLAMILEQLVVDVIGNVDLHKHYMPRTLWNYERN